MIKTTVPIVNKTTIPITIARIFGILVFKNDVHTAATGKPIKKPADGFKNTAIPELKPAKTGKPINPKNRYKRVALSA